MVRCLKKGLVRSLMNYTHNNRHSIFVLYLRPLSFVWVKICDPYWEDFICVSIEYYLGVLCLNLIEKYIERWNQWKRLLIRHIHLPHVICCQMWNNFVLLSFFFHWEISWRDTFGYLVKCQLLILLLYNWFIY